MSNRQISGVAGQGNNTAVGYHFGTKTDLLRAIIRKHAGRIGELREVMVDETFGPSVQKSLDGLNRCLPDLPLPVRTDRGPWHSSRWCTCWPSANAR
ncbi:hypothetical protein [Streptomyces sp. NBC_00893]|uniref:hypothetical protein n=1 Tax=Streptomyces sp. NBC_00893 TaxID=2975862 RepID=UPI002B1D1E84|nr:hypothetical protein [Streptomyces sp. NBC_00893]